jgi:hypothetical protein
VSSKNGRSDDRWVGSRGYGLPLFGKTRQEA